MSALALGGFFVRKHNEKRHLYLLKTYISEHSKKAPKGLHDEEIFLKCL